MMTLIKLFVLSVSMFFCHSAGAQSFSDSDKEKASQAAQYYKQQYWVCLAGEITKILPTKVTADDFKFYLAGACAAEKQSFRVPFVDYLAMKHPDMTLQDHFNAFDYVVQAAIDDSVKGLIEMRIQK